MRALGFAFIKEQVRWTLVTGTKAAPVFIDRGRVVYSPTLTPAELAVWFKRALGEIVRLSTPDKVVARLTWKIMTQAQSYHLIFPCAILELICDEEHIPCTSIGAQALTAKALGFPKGSDPNDECTARLGSHPPHWDKNQTNSGLAAIYGLD